MSYQNTDEELGVQKNTPIKITPLAEDFKENLYMLYEMYRPDRENTHYDRD